MLITYEQRKELNALSKEVYGRSSTWYNKVHKRGIYKSTQTGPTPHTTTVKWLTSYEEIKAHMLEVKANTEKLMEEMKKSQNGSI
jgi:hypothetical protein